ncbi:MAG TPA: CRISPR-associated endonuclease Cas3'', partial [Polyangiaceae bacterium]|nr:CRISPR-associated endonuclease Cas3'' [Polyangiaceae bacterium]
MLNQDALWVMDEVQLMDVGLSTSAQLQAFRHHHTASRPSATWWMSATLQPEWLATRDTQELCAAMPRTEIPEGDRVGHLWDDVTKTITLRTDASGAADLARLVEQAHDEAGSGRDGPTLVVVNTVDRAVELAATLRKRPALSTVDLRLVHSRFRAGDRATWRDEFLNRDACGPGTNRIIVATQVVEAGVDVSAALLVTDLAPWSSLVQRFGRAARWGGSARVIVVDPAPKDDKAASPYRLAELEAAREVLRGVTDVAPRSLEDLERTLDPAQRARLYPYDPEELIQEHEVEQLFDTTPDLSGADIDVSRFIRSGEERDLSVFWADVPEEGEPSPDLQPERAAICAVPFLKARAWLCAKKRRLLAPRSAWVWSWLDGRWRVAEASDLYPGQLVLVDANLGGYDWDDRARRGDGWAPASKQRVEPRATGGASAMDRADAAQDDESLSAARYRTIGTHVDDVAEVVMALGVKLAPAYAAVLETAALWHDVGKAHPAFQGSIHRGDRPPRDDLAKAPRDAWPRASLYRMRDGGSRPGFRHELASVLAMFQVLREVDPGHAALLGPWLGSPLIDEAARARAVPTRAAAAAAAAERRLLALSADDFDLCAYLVSAHHGKVRVSWHASPSDQVSSLRDGAITIRGVRSGDVLPSIRLNGEDMLPELTLDLAPAALGLSVTTGASFTERA